MPQRRLLTLLLVLGLLAAPAAALRATCIAGSCKKTATSHYVVPFCALPRETRSLVAAGYDEVTSPDVIAIAGRRSIVGTAGGTQEEPAVPWPSLSADADRIPIVLAGKGVPAGPLDPGTGLDDLTPSLERVLGLSPPSVTSGARRLGESIPGLEQVRTRLVLEVVWKAIGTRDLHAIRHEAPFLFKELQHAGTLHGTTGSLPVDPAATLTTLGTGSPPAQHGIVGTYLRSPYDGSLVRAWDIQTTPTALPSLANDMAREVMGSRQVLVATDPADGGTVGGAYYAGTSSPRTMLRPGPPSSQEAAAETVLRDGLGSDGTPDLLVVVMQGSVSKLDAATQRVVARARAASHGSLTAVITATGSMTGSDHAVPARAFVDRLERETGSAVVETATPSGLFLRPNVPAQHVADALSSSRLGPVRAAEGIPGYAIALAEFC